MISRQIPNQSTASFSLNKGDSVGHFQLQQLLYLGYMNAVYLVREENAQRLYVLKHATQKKYHRKIILEIKHLKELHTLPYVASLYTTGSDIRLGPYFVQEYSGASLSSLIQKETLSLRERFDVALQICSALEELHKRGWLLRDLKPANIVVHPKHLHTSFVDLASWIRLDDYKKLPLKGTVDATLQYAAPEQLAPRRFTEAKTQRIDIHALGVTLYELFVGPYPFRMQNIYDTMNKHIEGALPDVDSPHFSTTSNAVLEKLLHLCLQKAPSDRFTNVGAVSGAIRLLRERSCIE